MTEPSHTESYYDQRWAKEGKANSLAMARAALILSELAEIAVRDPRSLDFGCGTGWFTAILSQFGEAEGVDIAPGPARRLHPNLSFHDVQHVPPGLFDLVVSQEVIEHADDQAFYVSKAYEVLRPGGYLILTTPNAAVSLRHPELLTQPTEKHLNRRELRTLLSQRFAVQKLYSFFYGYARWRPYRIQMRFGRMLNAGLHLMAVCKRL